MSVHCIELLQRGVQGPLGYVRVYVHGLCNTWGLVRCIEHGSVCEGVHLIDSTDRASLVVLREHLHSSQANLVR